MSTAADAPEPDVQTGIDYWETQPASYDGVLGGFGTGSLPRIDALSSRQFLLYLMPGLSTVPSAGRPLNAPEGRLRRTRALDVGAGIGRVTADVLLHLVSDIVLVEPVNSLVREALKRGKASENGQQYAESMHPWKGISDKTKGVTFIQDTLQDFDPTRPSSSAKQLGHVGHPSGQQDLDSRFDVIWCQWCLGSLSDAGLVSFLQTSRNALRDLQKSLIIVKENCCSDGDDGSPRTVLDEIDSSLTRSDHAWKKIFKEAGLQLVYEQLQLGFPDGLYPVRMYALR